MELIKQRTKTVANTVTSAVLAISSFVTTNATVNAKPKICIIEEDVNRNNNDSFLSNHILSRTAFRTFTSSLPDYNYTVSRLNDKIICYNEWIAYIKRRGIMEENNNDKLEQLAIPMDNLLKIDFNTADHFKNEKIKMSKRDFFFRRAEAIEAQIKRCMENGDEY